MMFVALSVSAVAIGMGYIVLRRMNVARTSAAVADSPVADNLAILGNQPGLLFSSGAFDSTNGYLMIRQLGGRYQVKSQSLRPLYEEALKLLNTFERVKLVHVPREMNRAADEMSNQAIDERM